MCTEPNPECHYVSQVSRDFKACKLCCAAGPAREIRISATRFLFPDPSSRERAGYSRHGSAYEKSLPRSLSLRRTYFRPEDLVGNLTFHRGRIRGEDTFSFLVQNTKKFGSLIGGKKFQSQIYFLLLLLLILILLFFSKMLRLEKAVDEIFLRQKQNGSRLIDICKYFYDNVEEDRSKGSMYANYISRGRANIYKKILNLPC